LPPRSPDSVTAPRDLDDASRALWRLTITQLEEQGTWQVSDLPALERYIRASERARLARNALPRDRDGQVVMTAKGSQHQLVQHPNIKTCREAERDANDYAKELLLTPAARRRAQVEGGADPDDPLAGALG
jgi:P27 family predicted phage terminase small subunit